MSWTTDKRNLNKFFALGLTVPLSLTLLKVGAEEIEEARDSAAEDAKALMLP